MVVKIIVAIFIFVLIILCMKWTIESIRSRDDGFAAMCSIASSLFGLILGILLGSLIL